MPIHPLKIISGLKLKHLMFSERLYKLLPGSLRSGVCCMQVSCWLVYATFLLSQVLLLASPINQVTCLQDDDDLETSRWQVPSPNRPIPADIILLADGSNTSVSSLEEYLSQIERQDSTTLRSPLQNTTPTIVIATESSMAVIASDENNQNYANKAALSESLEREEVLSQTTTPTPTTLTSLDTGPANKPNELMETSQKQTAEIKHNLPAHEDHKHHKSSSSHHNNELPPTNSTGPKPILQHWQVRSLLNVTHDFPLTHSRLIYGYIWPMMAAITLFTNLMIVFVLTQHDMRTPTNVVLTAIAIADIIPIVVPVPWFIYLFAMGNEKQVLYPPIACYFYQHLTRSVSEIFYFLSTWLNVLLAVQDYLTACLPHLAKRYCQLKVVVMQIITCTLLAFLLNLPQALKLVFKPVKFYYQGQLTWGCKALQARWFKDLIGEYVALYDDIFAAIIVIFVDGGPAALLVTLTALLIRQLQKQRIQGHLLMEQARTASKRRRERHRQQEYESSAKVMIFVLIASLAVKIPFATTYTMMIIQSRFEIHFVENLVDFQSAITITDLAFVLSYPINFTIFCCCSKKFRHKCVQLLGECTHNTKSARNRLMSSFSMSLNSSTTSQIYKRPSIATTVASQNTNIATQQQTNNVINEQELDAKSSFDQTDSETWLEPLTRTGGSGNNNTSNNIRDVPLISSSSLDDRRPLVLERLCDGRHHLEWLHPGDRPPHFRALLADGSHCQECIARHEDLWAAQRCRRLSVDSNSGNWPLPPPMPQLHMANHYNRLPQIVTTRCESIREQPSSDETTGDELAMGGGGGGGNERPTNTTQSSIESWRQVDPGWPAGGAGARGSARGGNDTLSSSSRVHPEEEANQIHYQRGERHTQESQQEQIDRHERQNLDHHDSNQEHEDEDGDGQQDEGRLRRPAKGSGGPHTGLSPSWNHGGSDPGSGSSFMSLKYLKGVVLRRLSGQDERDHTSTPRRGDHLTGSHNGRLQASQASDERGPCREHMNDKHSSLSLSNSKLTTLPNATGQLADILMSTLLMGQPGGSQSSNQSRGALSEPASNHNSSRGERSRARKGSCRRSHG